MLLLFSLLSVSGDRNWANRLNVPVSDTWHFVALGDTRQHIGHWDEESQCYSTDNSSHPVRAALINSIVENNPNVEFIIHTGDMVKSGGEQDDWDRYFEDIENATKNNLPFYYAVGNHELYNYALGNGVWAPADEDFTIYLNNVELPGNERYYSFDYNSQIHFIFINTEEYWDGGFDITSDQKSWLINDLENNKTDFIVAVFHRPCYSIRDSGRVEDAHQVRNVLEPLFLQFGVDLVFSGHDHYYYHTIRNGITHVVTGGGGADLASNNDLSEWQDGDVFFSEYHYCNITVSETDGNLTVKVDSLIFHDNNKSTTLADSFKVPLFPIGTSSTTTTTIETTTEKMGTTSASPKTSLTTNSAFVSITLSLTVISLIKKSKKLKKFWILNKVQR